MKDLFGQELKVGDFVAVLVKYTKYSTELKIGIITKFTPKAFRFKTKNYHFKGVGNQQK